MVEDARTGRVLHREPVRAGQAFELSYVHSSEHVPVRGVVRVEPDGSLSVTETAFAGFGPGLPALAPGDPWRIEDGMIVAGGPGPRLPEIRLRVSPIARQRLVGPSGRAVELDELVSPGGAVIIRVRSSPRAAPRGQVVRPAPLGRGAVLARRERSGSSPRCEGGRDGVRARRERHRRGARRYLSLRGVKIQPRPCRSLAQEP